MEILIHLITKRIRSGCGSLQRSGIGMPALIFLFAALHVVSSPAVSYAHPQRVVVRAGGVVRVPGSNQEEETPIAPAPLKTDPQLESIMEQAGRFQEEDNWRTATQLWQTVLNRSGDTLYSIDEEVYFSLSRQVEKVLAGLPPEGLKEYRVNADAGAREIIAGAGDENDVIALNRVVRDYFVSSLGDESAYRLGCIYLDRHDFTGARRMFEKIVDRYPDPTIPLAQVHVRIALCQACLGEQDAAVATLEKARRIGDPGAIPSIDALERSMKQGDLPVVVPGGSGDWTMALGDSRRYGVMPSLAEDYGSDGLVARWQYFFSPLDRFANQQDAKGAVLTSFDNNEIRDTLTSREEEILKVWKEKSWNPAGSMLISDGKLYFKSGADVVSWELESIEKQVEDDTGPESISDVLWRSTWRNSFMMDDASTMMRVIVKNYQQYAERRGAKFSEKLPRDPAEVMLFGDRINQGMSLYNGVLYSIEGERFDLTNKHRSSDPNAPWNVAIRRTRSNFLTAYDAQTGAVLWRLPDVDSGRKAEFGVDEERPFLESGGFMSAPVGFGKLVIAPVNHSGGITVYAFDPANGGRTVWKSFLCDEPDSSASLWSPIELSIEGSDLFVNCGMGVVFVLDPATGTIRFARKYERTAGKIDQTYVRLRWTHPRVTFHGWKDDVVIPLGREMISFASDSYRVESYDRGSGEILWWAELEQLSNPVDYILGVYDGKLYAAGPETIVAFDLKGEGRLRWGGSALFDGEIATGRGMLTPDGIYIPVGDTIHHFDLQGTDDFDANLVGKIKVENGTGAPLGNLFSDGKRIWVNGANRLYGLWPKE